MAGDSWEVRRLGPEETDAAVDLAWETFLEFEAPDYGAEGTQTFWRDVAGNEGFRERCKRGEVRVWGAHDGTVLAGMMAVRGEGHICLAFTRGEYMRRGVGSAIFRKIVEEIRLENPGVSQMTVNSSPYGAPFYRGMGFAEEGGERTSGGMRYIPMTYLMAHDERH